MTSRPLAAFTAVLVAFAPCASAAGRFALDVGRIELEGLVVEGLQAEWSPAAGGRPAASVRAARVRGLPATGPLSGFSAQCGTLVLSGDVLRCEQGRLQGAFGPLGRQDTRFTAERLGDGRLRLDLAAVAVGGGRMRARVDLDGARWSVDATLSDLDVATLAQAAQGVVALPVEVTPGGGASGIVRAAGTSARLESARAEVDFEAIAFSDAEGTLAGENVGGRIEAEARRAGGERYRASARMALGQGQAYLHPLFLDFRANAVALDFAGAVDAGAGRIEAERFALDHAGVLQASGDAVIDFAEASPVPKAHVVLSGLDLAGALPVYAQPFLVDSAFKDVVGTGTVRGEVEIEGAMPRRASLEFQDVAIDSPAAALALAGISGQVRWYDDATRTALAGQIDDALFQSSLSWKSGRLWGLDLGAAELPFATTGRHFRLLEPVVLPVFDGGLAIDQLRVRHAGTPDMYVRFEAAIEPIDVSKLSRAFGWPEFHGTIAGKIPGIQLRQGVFSLDGNFEADVFGGKLTIRDMSLADPLGKFPQLRASVDFEDLDLELVTSTFSFGMITGKLSGYLHGLETFGWMPEAFDAFFYTPADDKSRRRISQRAVENLSSIGGGSGGGVAAALQGGFLQFFDDFGYDRIGLSCRLANDVCIMGGVQPAPGGYYIVKGAGIPRINVIGSQARVAWTTLVHQLAAVTESEIVVR